MVTKRLVVSDERFAAVVVELHKSPLGISFGNGTEPGPYGHEKLPVGRRVVDTAGKVDFYSLRHADLQTGRHQQALTEGLVGNHKITGRIGRAGVVSLTGLAVCVKDRDVRRKLQGSL